MKKKILFINQSQYGYHIDYVQYCKYLKEDYDITFLCWDYKKNIVNEPGVIVEYISRDGNIIIRNFRFIQNALKCLNHHEFSLVFIHYFRGSSLIRFFSKNHQLLHLDIRTGSISPKIIDRYIFNFILQFESLFFSSISIISEGLRKKLHIKENAFILPLGATKMNVLHQSKHMLHLLYVGTFTNRHLFDTIEGFYLFLKEQPQVDIHYTIVGDGWGNEKVELENRINQLGLKKHIELTGYVPYNELLSFYENANIGISYIPLTSYYEYQPATKTFEYLMTGMPVIATQTYENKQVINKYNGVLISDNPNSFAEGISQIYKNLNLYEDQKIKKSVESYEWSRIIQTMKEKILSD